MFDWSMIVRITVILEPSSECWPQRYPLKKHDMKHPLHLLHHGFGSHWLHSHCFFGLRKVVPLFLPQLKPTAKHSYSRPNNTQASFRRGVSGPKTILKFWLLWNYKEAKHIKHISKRKQRVPTCTCHLNVDPFSTKKKHKTTNKLFLRHWIQYFPPRNQNKGKHIERMTFHIPHTSQRKLLLFFSIPTIFQA